MGYGIVGSTVRKLVHAVRPDLLESRGFLEVDWGDVVFLRCSRVPELLALGLLHGESSQPGDVDLSYSEFVFVVRVRSLSEKLVVSRVQLGCTKHMIAYCAKLLLRFYNQSSIRAHQQSGSYSWATRALSPIHLAALGASATPGRFPRNPLSPMSPQSLRTVGQVFLPPLPPCTHPRLRPTPQWPAARANFGCGNSGYASPRHTFARRPAPCLLGTARVLPAYG